MAEHELWSFTTALFFIILMIGFTFVMMFGIQTIADIDHIKADWANQRCTPFIMPFAGYFGFNAKENFEFCMGKVFSAQAQPMLGSITGIFGKFTTVLQSIFHSVNSLRNVIASLGGGINVIFQEFTERISMFFFKLRLTAIHMKSLFMRMYAILFSVMYMGMSGISGMSSFTNTFLFSFLDTFCFPGETELMVKDKGRVPIKDIQMGDVLLPGHSVVTGTFEFEARGQPMVQLGPVTVSTNHYVMHEGKPIKAGNHPHAISKGTWKSAAHLYCLNTHNHIIPVEYLEFMDYDETSSADKETMNWIEQKLNAEKNTENRSYSFTEYGFAIDEDAMIRTTTGECVKAKEIRVGDSLFGKGMVAGIIRKVVHEVSRLDTGVELTPSTLYWDTSIQKWKRIGDTYPSYSCKKEMVSLVVIPHSIIELENGLLVRDYMEICSPDSELYYAKQLESLS